MAKKSKAKKKTEPQVAALPAEKAHQEPATTAEAPAADAQESVEAHGEPTDEGDEHEKEEVSSMPEEDTASSILDHSPPATIVQNDADATKDQEAAIEAANEEISKQQGPLESAPSEELSQLSLEPSLAAKDLSLDPMPSQRHAPGIAALTTDDQHAVPHSTDSKEEPSQLPNSNHKILTNGDANHASHIDSTLTDQLTKSQEQVAQLVAENEKIQKELARVEEEKAQTDAQYRNLFGKVTQMKTTLGARLKQDAEELSQNRVTIEELENQITVLNETVAHMQDKIVQSTEEMSASQNDKSSLAGENTRLKSVIDELQTSLTSERSMRTAAEERNMVTAAEWENLAVEERTARDSLRDRINDLEEQLAAQNNAYENLRSIVEQDNQTINKLKQQTYELQETHEKELQQKIASLQSSIDTLEEQKKTFESRMELMRTNVHDLESDVEKLRPYEQEVKEKNLLIGKLRHEAVILNEHLTKALRLLKRGSSNDSVDRQLLNNLLLSFFQLPRQDSKRFEVLKILSSVLAWDDLQKEQAGLIRPGSAAISSLSPMSPTNFRSPPSSPNLSRGGISRRASGAIQLQAADFMGPNRESMSDLWINFLQSEAAMNAADAVQQE